MALPITITDAGRAEIINTQNTGTGPVTITEIGFGTGQYNPSKAQTALQAQVKRLGSIAGQAVADDTIHVMAKDESADAYNVGEFGLFSDQGTLIAVYSQPAASGWIIQKAAPSTLLLATDIILESLDATSITFGDILFINPPATESVAGVVMLVNNLVTGNAARALTASMGKKLQDEKAPLASPALTGTPTAPTPATSSSNTQIATTAFVKAVVAALVDSSPGTLDTLNELAQALGNDPSFATTMANALAAKAPLASPALTGTPTAPTAAAGTNTTQLATTAFVAAVQTALTTLINAKAPLASPALTGIPTAPTAAAGTNTTQLATTAFVAAVQTALTTLINAKAPLASPALTGTPTAPTPATSSSNTQIATTAFVKAVVAALVDSSPGTLDTLNELAQALGNDPNFATTMANALAAKAPLASPALTGTPTAPTAAAGTNTTQLATTAFVAAVKTALTTLINAKAPLASPALTGSPTAPTQAAGNNSTRLATTAFVQAALNALPQNSANLGSTGGWFKDESTGLILQFGYLASRPSVISTHPFPTTFPNACFGVLLVEQHTAQHNDNPKLGAAPGTSSFTIHSDALAYPLRWFAIGY